MPAPIHKCPIHAFMMKVEIFDFYQTPQSSPYQIWAWTGGLKNKNKTHYDGLFYSNDQQFMVRRWVTYQWDPTTFKHDQQYRDYKLQNQLWIRDYKKQYDSRYPVDANPCHIHRRYTRNIHAPNKYQLKVPPLAHPTKTKNRWELFAAAAMEIHGIPIDHEPNYRNDKFSWQGST